MKSVLSCGALWEGLMSFEDLNYYCCGVSFVLLLFKIKLDLFSVMVILHCLGCLNN